MLQMLRYARDRIACVFFGHDMRPGEFFYPPASAVVEGWVCERCGKTQLMLYKWQRLPGREG